MSASNQCMGCQAGWFKRTVVRLGGDLSTYVIHEVKGGYPGEIVRCTADRYDDQSTPPSKP